MAIVSMGTISTPDLSRFERLIGTLSSMVAPVVVSAIEIFFIIAVEKGIILADKTHHNRIFKVEESFWSLGLTTRFSV